MTTLTMKGGDNLPKKIKLNGTVVGDGNAWIYEWLGIPFISPSTVHNALEQANGEDVEVYINSGGGSSFVGSEIYTALKEYSGTVIVKIPSIAGSAASVFAMAGNPVLISPTAQIMIHNSATWTDGNKGSHQQSVQMLDSVDEGMINAYIAKTGRTRDEIAQLMDNETFLNAQKAVELGFADEIMFATEEFAPVASAGMGTELPPEVLDKVRNKILATMSASGKYPAAKIPTTKEETKSMDFKELQEKHPELVKDIMATASQEAIKAERTRIADLNALGDAPGAAQFISDAITSGETAAEVAMKIVQASATRVKTEGQGRMSDSQSSNAAQVAALPPVDQTKQDEEDEDKSIKSMVEYARELINKKGGRG